MEKRRTYSPGSKKNRGKRVVTILGIVLGLILIFYISFVLSSKLFIDDNGPSGDFSGMTVEEKIEELERQVKEKDDEIAMLKGRLERFESAATAATPSPSPTPSPTPPSATSQPTTTPPRTNPPTAAPTATKPPLPPATQQPTATLIPQPPSPGATPVSGEVPASETEGGQ